MELSDPYERQLLAVFESCDVKGTGRLDCDGLTKLCDQLHLEDGRSQLMDCLLPAFTFHQFRDALLALLGASRRHSSSDREPSPEREVSPKFVFGQKKYGRRSRPESSEQEDDALEDSDDEDNTADCDTFMPPSPKDCTRTKKKVPASSFLIDDCQSDPEAVETPTFVQSVVLDKEEMESPRGQGETELRSASCRLGLAADGYLSSAELAQVCRAVGMEKMADEVVKQVFAKLDVDAEGRISFEEFLQLFRSSHSAAPPPHQHSAASYQQQNLNSLDVTSSGFVSGDSLVDLWEAGGVMNAQGLLVDLGLTHGSDINLAALAAMLEEEVRSMASKCATSSPQVNALTAALTLAHTQLKFSRSCLEQMRGERDKLHVDLAEANQRAALMAHEVDDRHARMERASQMQIKLLEQRHAEQVKQLTLQLAMDRDQLTAATLRLEKKLAAQQEEEAKMRASLNTLQSEFEAMEKESQSLSEQLAACEVVKNKAEKDSLQIQQLRRRVQELESGSEQLEKLVEQLDKLKTENTSLRDRNDELTIQVENLSARVVYKRQSSCVSVEGGVGGGTKRRGHSPLALPPDHLWEEESPRLGKVRRYCTDPDVSLDSVPMEGLAIGRTLCLSESGVEADLDTLDNSFTLSSPSVDNKLTFTFGGCEDTTHLVEIEQLRSTIAALRQDNDEYRKRLAVGSAGTTTSRSRDDEGSSGGTSYAATQATESTEVQTSLENISDVNLLEKHCHELRHTLENVKEEIVKILSEKKACSEENCALKQKIEDLSRRLPKTLSEEPRSLENPSGPLTYTITDVPNTQPETKFFQPVICDNVKDSPQNAALKCFPFMNHIQKTTNSPYRLFPTKDKQDCNAFKFENLSQFAFELSQSLSDPNTEDGPFSNLGCKPLPACLNDTDDACASREVDLSEMKGEIEEAVTMTTALPLEGEADGLTREKCESVEAALTLTTASPLEAELDRLTRESQQWREKCAELEAGLELMRVEYEKCEDYWQGKLNEERAIFDQEQRLSDDKFVELETKIQEYAELFNVDDRKNNHLPTIEEKDSLEKQVTDLEEEFQEFKLLAQKESHLKSEEITRLLRELQELQAVYKSKEKDTQEIGVQASDQPLEFRLHEPRTSPPSKACVPVIELTPDSIECCCPCHSLSRKALSRLRDSRSRLQAECEMLHRRREVMLHQLTQIQQRSNLIYTPLPERRLASDVEMFHNLSSRLRHQELRCRHLQTALKHHQRQTDKLLQDAWDQHRADLTSAQKTLHITQEKLQHQTKLCKQQMERLSSSDVLVKDLYKENAFLTSLVQKLEEQNLFVDRSILSCSTV